MAPNDPSYRVELRADDTTLCPGQCTSVVVEVSNGTPPYAYAWNRADMAGAGPFEVCPSQTTSFEVVATDSFSTIEEFGGEDREATGALQIAVTDDCEAPDDRVPPPIDAAPGQPICELRVASDSTRWFHPAHSFGALSSMSVDAHGNLYFVAWIGGGTIQIGDMSIEGTENTDGLVVKLSPTCEPIWLKPLRTTLTGSLSLRSLAVSPSGEDIYVTGNLEGAALFAGETVGGGSDNSGLLLKLDGQGEVLWVEAALSTTHAMLNDVAIADNGDVIVTGFGLDGATFAGLGALTDGNSWSSFVARVRPDGTGVFFHGTPHGSEELSVTLLPSGAIMLMGWGLQNIPLELAGGVIDAPDNDWAVYVAMLEAEGDFVWGKAVRTGPAHGWTSFVSTTMTVDRAGNLLIDESHYEEPPSGTIISTPPELIRIDPAGNELWSRERPYRRTSDNLWSGGIAVDADDNILVLDEVVAGTVTENGDVLEPVGVNDFMLSKRTEDGELIWLWQSGGAEHDWCWGLTTDAQGAIWVGSGSTDLETGDGEFVITRIAP